MIFYLEGVMKRVYKKSKKLLQTSSLLALALSLPLKAALPESLEDRAARAVAKSLATKHPMEKEGKGDFSPYFELAAMSDEAVVSAVVHYLPEDTRVGLLNFIGGSSSDQELTLQHKYLVSCIVEELRKDQSNSLELSFDNDQIMGRHELLGPEFINLNRFFLNADSNYFSILEVKVKVEDAVANPNILSRLNKSGISRLKLAMSQESTEAEKAVKLSTFFQSDWDQLEALDLSHNKIGAVGATAIADSKTLTNLQSLNLAWNAIGPDGARAIANSPTFANLQSLDLELNAIDADGARAIADSKFLTNLQDLNLSSNNIGPDGGMAIADSKILTNLQSLNLADNAIGPDGATAIANSKTLTNLQDLNLSFNEIGDDGTTAIANSPNLKNLQSLNLVANGIGAAEQDTIERNPIFKNTQIDF